MTRTELQAAIQRARKGRKRARLPAELKAAVLAHYAERRAVGARWAEIAAELSVAETQLQRWSAERGSKLQRIEVVNSPVASSELCLELPGAVRVTGLSIVDIAALLRELR